MINNKRAKHLIDTIEQLRSVIKSNKVIMDKAKPILECVLPYIVAHERDIKAGINDFGNLQPALNVMLEFEEIN